MKLLLSSLFLSISLFVSAQAIDFSHLVADDAFWSKTSTGLYGELRPYGFTFSDSSRTELVSASYDLLSFSGIGLYSASILLKDDRPIKVVFSVFNKGDADNLSCTEGEFNDFANAITAKIDAFCGYKYYTVPKENLGSHKYVIGRKWIRKSPYLLLEWAYTGKPYFSPEFIRLSIIRKSNNPAADSALLTGKGLKAKSKSTVALRKNILRTSNGDTYIDAIPMVDQGSKGYCAVSSAERLLRYYGLTVDQHKVALLAESSARQGTDTEIFIDAVKHLAREYDLAFKLLIAPDTFENGFEKSKLADDISRYNKALKRLKRNRSQKTAHLQNVREINIESFMNFISPTHYVIDILEIYRAFDPDVLLAAKSDQKQAFTTFKNEIYKSIDKGTPILWSVMVGIYPEVPDIGTQVFGHMRLIIGYNKAKNEIIYSDSWGAGHEIKRMPANQAWAMTRGLISITPK